MAKFIPRPFGKYFLLDKLAVGGMAEIYKAKTFGVDGFEKLLAIKKILPHCSADKDFITMLIDEAKLSVLLSHTNIVQVYDLGKVGDDYYISMEFIDGSNLRQLIQQAQERHQQLPTAISVYIMSEICKGLDYAHRKKDHQNQPLHIVHRDISPQNILISFDGEVKIVDFGIAKAAMNISQTMTGVLKGKVSYMAPEQALGKHVDQRTDIFGAALVFYEMLAGKKLFTGETQLEVLKKIHSTHITEASFGDEIPTALKGILAKALAFNVEDRFETAGDLQIELTKYLYSTHHDFSPRQLATLMQKWFEDELIARKEKVLQEYKAGDAKVQTIRMSVQDENLVHRGDDEPSHPTLQTAQTEAVGGQTLTALPNDRMMAAGVTSQTKKTNTERHTASQLNPEPKSQFLMWGLIALLLIALTSGGIYLYSVISSRTTSTPAPLPKGSLAIQSTPPGAEIIIDGKVSPFKTPTTVSDLDLYTAHTVVLRLADHEAWTKQVTLTSTDPMSIDAQLISTTHGALAIESTPPGASILIDGADTGKTTPATIADISINQAHKVTLSKPGFTPLDKEITVSAGQPTQWQASLEPIAPPKPVVEPTLPPPVEEKPKPTPPPPPISKPVTKEPKKPVQESSPPTTAGRAYVALSSVPEGATVYLNGLAVGRTPGNFPTSSGRVELMVESEGLSPYRTTLNLKPDEHKKLGTIQLETTTGKVRIDSVPRGAMVYFDDEQVGPTPVVVRGVERGEPYRVRVVYRGLPAWEKTITLMQSSLEIMADLKGD